MSIFGTFPFGQPILPVRQQDKSAKQVFVLGVYASAVPAGTLRAVRAEAAILVVFSPCRRRTSASIGSIGSHDWFLDPWRAPPNGRI